MTETLRLEFHKHAQPVRSVAGWLLACYAPSDGEQLTLLLDLGPTDQYHEWHALPDGEHRTLLMLDSPQVFRVHFQLHDRAERSVKLPGAVCTLLVTGGGTMTVGALTGYFYDLLITCSPA